MVKVIMSSLPQNEEFFTWLIINKYTFHVMCLEGISIKFTVDVSAGGLQALVLKARELHVNTMLVVDPDKTVTELSVPSGKVTAVGIWKDEEVLTV